MLWPFVLLLELLSLVPDSPRERGKGWCAGEKNRKWHIEALRKRSGEGRGSHRKPLFIQMLERYCNLHNIWTRVRAPYSKSTLCSVCIVNCSFTNQHSKVTEHVYDVSFIMHYNVPSLCCVHNLMRRYSYLNGYVGDIHCFIFIHMYIHAYSHVHRIKVLSEE